MARPWMGKKEKSNYKITKNSSFIIIETFSVPLQVFFVYAISCKVKSTKKQEYEL
jgi:hypothetical protein